MIPNVENVMWAIILIKMIFASYQESLAWHINCGLCIGDVKLESFAYADDVSLFSSTVTGLQNLVDACYYYSKKWRFNFGIKKSECESWCKHI